MRYFGGKYAIKKDLWEILNKETKGRVFIDLFCGVCNVVEGITTANQRIANDNNPKIQKSNFTKKHSRNTTKSGLIELFLKNFMGNLS